MALGFSRKDLLLAVICASQFIFMLSPAFKISKVDVEGNRFLTTERVLADVNYKPGMYYWQVRMIDGFSKPVKDPLVLNSRVSLKAGGNVSIKIFERKPVALIYSEKSGSRWLSVDKEGVILGDELAGSELRRVKVDFDVPARGHMRNPALIAVANEAGPLVEKALGFKPLFYIIDSSQSISAHISFLNNEVLVKIGTIEMMPAKIEVLKTLLATLKAKSQPVDMIDVRFAQSVVKLHSAADKKQSETDAASGSVSEDMHSPDLPGDEVTPSGEERAPVSEPEPPETPASETSPSEPVPPAADAAAQEPAGMAEPPSPEENSGGSEASELPNDVDLDAPPLAEPAPGVLDGNL